MTSEANVSNVILSTFFSDGFRGNMVEVGAAGPEFLSVGNDFRTIGWNVISIEPNPVFCKAHREKGNKVYQFACGDHDADSVPFFIVDSHGISYNGGSVSYESFSSLGITGLWEQGLKKLPSASVTEILVSVRRLDTILQKECDFNKVNVVSIDVEGWEMTVLKGFSLNLYQPDVVIVEEFLGSTGIQSYLSGFEYLLWKTLYPNNVYVRSEILNSLETFRGRK